MKYILSLLFPFLLSLPVFSQSAPEIEGKLIRSGPLIFNDKVVGHYRLTDNRQTDDQNYVYTITLLGNDLQILGNKLYESDVPLAFGGIAYNGTYLGVAYRKTSKNEWLIDVLDGSGARIHQEIFNRLYYSRKSFLLPTDAGFVSCLSRNGKGGREVFDVSLVNLVEESSGWTKSFSGDKEGVVPHLVTFNSERVVVAVERYTRARMKCYQDVYCIDVKTGALIFNHKQDKPSNLAFYEDVITGALIDDGVILAYDAPESTKDKARLGFKLIRLDAEGELMKSEIHFDKDFFNKALIENKLPALEKYVSVKRTGIEMNPEGIVTVAFEVSSTRTKNGKWVNGKEYQDAYVLTMTPDFQIGPLVRLEKKHFSLTPQEEAYEGPQNLMQKRMNKGEIDKVSLNYLLEIHNGPYGFALAVSGTDYISNYFLDRDFTKVNGVVYYGVTVATYIDGEFELDYIPFKNKPDYITLGRARDGYIKITEYKYGEGIVDVHLERLSY